MTLFTLQSASNIPVAIWIDVPSPSYVGCQSLSPFTVYLSTEGVMDHTVVLYAQNSNSQPNQLKTNKWSKLIPQWRFTDLSGNIITDIVPEIYSTVYNVSGEAIGCLASGQFYYIDDMPTGSCDPILIWATVDFSQYAAYLDRINVPSYVNSKVSAVILYYVNGKTPTQLEITRDGENPLFDYYWSNTNIPNIISVNGTLNDCNSILHYIPTTNELGLSGGVIERTVLSALDQTWSPSVSAAYLSAIDSDNFNVGGYLVNTVNIGNTLNQTTITASASVYYDPTIINTPIIWISNPDNNTINKIYYGCISNTLLQQLTSKIEKEKIIISQGIYSVPFITELNLDLMGLTGFGGIFGIAVDVDDYSVWGADYEMDNIYKFSSNGVLLSTITCISGSQPAGISFDSNKNIYVALYGNSQVNKYDFNGTYLYTISSTDVVSISTDNLFLPTLAETDRNDNVWISFNNSLCSCLYKYDSLGYGPCAIITLPTCACPMDITIDSNNNIWATLTNTSGPPYNLGYVRKYNGTSYALICSITAVLPEFISLDSSDNVWFTQNFNLVTKIDNNGVQTNYSIGSVTALDWMISGEKLEYNALGGLTVDTSDRVFVINSIENNLYEIKNNAVNFIITISPNLSLQWFNDNNSIQVSAVDIAKSAQAFGDWTGGRWVRKYSTYFNTTGTQAIFLTGESEPFDVLDFSGLDIRRFNESWDAGPEMQKLAIAEHINNNTNYWGEYIGATFGTKDSPQGKAFGRQAYEKIANFVKNHSNIDTCNVDQLYDLAQETDVVIDDYGFNYPPLLRRIMDIVSVNQQQLWGSRCACNMNLYFESQIYLSGSEEIKTEYICKRCGHKHPGNRGTLFDPLTYMVSAGTPFILQDKYLQNTFEIVIPPLSSVTLSASIDPCIVHTTFSSISTYSLSANYYWLLPNLAITTPSEDDFLFVVSRFCFYNYVDGKCNEQIAGLINWSDEHTTLEENLSSIDGWYGAGGSVEKMISFILHEGLGLIED